jgi:hypothetical protein
MMVRVSCCRIALYEIKAVAPRPQLLLAALSDRLRRLGAHVARHVASSNCGSPVGTGLAGRRLTPVPVCALVV